MWFLKKIFCRDIDLNLNNVMITCYVVYVFLTLMFSNHRHPKAQSGLTNRFNCYILQIYGAREKNDL